ncbi:SDR family oxidoreductase [Psychroserpens sp. S379A]|uniref:SDR family oxidoreductase n=1 Tax=Psychroserpens sp. S379A TaxID=3415137 RepID=UPI003C7D390B
MKHITVIGATGKLGTPTVKRLLENGVQVKAVVRNVESAQQQLPENVTIVEGDLTSVESLKTALEGTEYLYLNLSAPDPYANFIPEVQGVENILEAAGSQLKQIIQISGLGALHPEYHAKGEMIIDNKLRKTGHDIIRKYGVPHTVFHATWFVNALPWFIQEDQLFVFGTYKTPMYWTNTHDLADYITKAIGNEATFNKDFDLQGETAMSYLEAAKRFVALKQLDLNVINVPVPEHDLGHFGDMLRYFEQFEEVFSAQETYAILGKPERSLDEAIATVL